MVAVSRVRLRTPELDRLEEIGLVEPVLVAEVQQHEIDQGHWLGLEPGGWWSGPDSTELHHRIGSYSYWAAWREGVWHIGPGPALSGLLIHADWCGGWGASAAAEILEEMQPRREEALKRWQAQPETALTAREWIGTWDQLVELLKIAADNGIVRLW